MPAPFIKKLRDFLVTLICLAVALTPLVWATSCFAYLPDSETDVYIWSCGGGAALGFLGGCLVRIHRSRKNPQPLRDLIGARLMILFLMGTLGLFLGLILVTPSLMAVNACLGEQTPVIFEGPVKSKRVITGNKGGKRYEVVIQDRASKSSVQFRFNKTYFDTLQNGDLIRQRFLRGSLGLLYQRR